MEASIKKSKLRVNILTSRYRHSALKNYYFYDNTKTEIIDILFDFISVHIRQKLIWKDNRNNTKFSSEYFSVIYVFVRGILSLWKKSHPK